MFMFLGVEDVFGVPYVVALGIYGVFALGITGTVSLWVPGDLALGITGVVVSVFLSIFYHGADISVPSKIFF